MRIAVVVSLSLSFTNALVLSASAGAEASPLTSIDEIYASASQETDVSVVGIVAQYQYGTSASGTAYEVLQFCQNRCLTVFLPNRTRLNDGDPVHVVGRFKPRVTAGSHTFYNEIIATSVEPYQASTGK